MSRQRINDHRAALDRLRAVSGSRRESVLREAFKDLLKRWGRSRDLQFVAEHEIARGMKGVCERSGEQHLHRYAAADPSHASGHFGPRRPQ